MEIVIKIPESILDIIYKDKTLNCEQLAILQRCIRNGILLPKGHGDLVDADAILEDPIGDTYKDLEIAEAIIPADTESEE